MIVVDYNDSMNKVIFSKAQKSVFVGGMDPQ